MIQNEEAKRRNVRMLCTGLIAITFVAVVCTYVIHRLQCINWIGYSEFDVQIWAARPIRSLESVGLDRNQALHLRKPVDSDADMLRNFADLGWRHHMKHPPDSNRIRVQVKALGTEATLLWREEISYYRQPFFALYGRFEDGTAFAKIVEIPKERDYRGMIVVELP